jgi:hypothetical protein
MSAERAPDITEELVEAGRADGRAESTSVLPLAVAGLSASSPGSGWLPGGRRWNPPRLATCRRIRIAADLPCRFVCPALSVSECGQRPGHCAHCPRRRPGAGSKYGVTSLKRHGPGCSRREGRIVRTDRVTFQLFLTARMVGPRQNFPFGILNASICADARRCTLRIQPH